jgi:hypothetical protein
VLEELGGLGVAPAVNVVVDSSAIDVSQGVGVVEDAVVGTHALDPAGANILVE